MSRCAQAEAACPGTGEYCHQDDEEGLQPAAKATTLGPDTEQRPGAPGLLLGCDMCPGFQWWPRLRWGSGAGWEKPTREKLQGSRASRAGVPQALLFPKMSCCSIERDNLSS